MIHLHGCWYVKSERRPRCDTRALTDARTKVIRELENHKAEREFDAKPPRHFNERQFYLQHGEKP